MKMGDRLERIGEVWIVDRQIALDWTSSRRWREDLGAPPRDMGTARGVTSIYTGTGRAIFGVPFFEQEINFGVSFLVRL